MHDHPLKKQDLSPAEATHLEQRLIRALETVPEPHIPSDFAARVASRLPAERPVSLTPTHYGQKAMLIGIIATLAILLALASHASSRPSFGLVESFLFTQFVVLVIWLSVWRHSLR
jgi:hypothetical protein